MLAPNPVILRNQPVRRESAKSLLREVWPVWLVLALVTTLPYLIAMARTPDGYVFTGVLTAYDDTFTYLAWMRQGAEGRALMCDHFTSEPHPCEFFLPLWLLLGIVCRITGASLALGFHTARLVAGLAALAVAYAAARNVMKSRVRARYALWLYGTSGGLGWLVYALNEKTSWIDAPAAGSADLNIPEATLLRSMFAQAHFTLGAALLCGAICLMFTALGGKGNGRAFIAGVLVSLLAVIHPYAVIVACAVSAVAALLYPWLTGGRISAPGYTIAARAIAAFCAAALPGLAYLLYLNTHSAVLRQWQQGLATPSPPPAEYLLGFGVVAALAVVGFRLMWKSSRLFGRLLLVWAVTQSALLYAPVNFQRRLVEGLQLPLSIAAAVAVFWLARRFRMRKLLIAGLIVFASLTNLGFIAGQIYAPPPDPRRYMPADLAAAFEWLRINAEPDHVLLTSYMTGNLAPSMTGLRVYLGHYDQTLDSPTKGEYVRRFYEGDLSDEQARKLLSDHRVAYVMYGPFERELTHGFDAPPWLTLAHRSGSVEVFKNSIKSVDE